jgi:hypothetical protein
MGEVDRLITQGDPASVAAARFPVVDFYIWPRALRADETNGMRFINSNTSGKAEISNVFG